MSKRRRKRQRYQKSRRLRGADAVYAAVAQQYGTTLVTLDRQQLERLPPAVRTVRPADVLGEIETSS